MRPLRRALAFVALVLGAASLAAPAAGAAPHVARLDMTGTIDQVNASYIDAGIASAAQGGATAVLIVIDSPGGELTSMDDMIKAILASPIPVITWVSPAGARAGSAATFIAMAGDVLAMAPNTNIGAAAVVDSSGNNLPSTLDKKVTNDAVARITELAKAHDRNATWAESAVRDAASIGSAEAVAMSPPVADLLAENVNQLFAAIDTGKRADGYAYRHDGQALPKLSGLPVDTIDMNFGQQFLHLLSDPNIAFILFTVGFYGIIAELFHPNFFSGTLGAIAIVLAWIGSNSLPLNIGGLLLILLGVGLFVLELHVTSYGLLTVGGVVCFILGAFALWTGVTPGQEAINVTVHPLLVGLVLALTLVYFYGLIRAMLRMRRQSPVPVEIDEMVGRTGVAQTLISPTGIAYAAGEAWSARSAQGEIAPGQTLRVVDVKGLELIVEPVGGSPPPAAASASEGDASHG